MALAELELALAKEPDLADATIYFYLGLAHNHLDQHEEAIEAYEASLASDPGLQPAHWNLALTLLDLERYAEAKARFEIYLQLDPDAAPEVEPFLKEIQRLLGSDVS